MVLARPETAASAVDAGLVPGGSDVLLAAVAGPDAVRVEASAVVAGVEVAVAGVSYPDEHAIPAPSAATMSNELTAIVAFRVPNIPLSLPRSLS